MDRDDAMPRMRMRDSRIFFRRLAAQQTRWQVVCIPCEHATAIERVRAGFEFGNQLVVLLFRRLCLCHHLLLLILLARQELARSTRDRQRPTACALPLSPLDWLAPDRDVPLLLPCRAARSRR